MNVLYRAKPFRVLWLWRDQSEFRSAHIHQLYCHCVLSCLIISCLRWTCYLSVFNGTSRCGPFRTQNTERRVCVCMCNMISWGSKINEMRLDMSTDEICLHGLLLSWESREKIFRKKVMSSHWTSIQARRNARKNNKSPRRLSITKIIPPYDGGTLRCTRWLKANCLRGGC